MNPLHPSALTSDDFLRLVMRPLLDPALWALLLFVLVDSALGIALAIKTDTFEWRYLSGFLTTAGLWQVGGWLIFQEAGQITASGIFGPLGEVIGGVAQYGSSGAIFLKIVADILDKLNKLGAPLSPVWPSKHRRRGRSHRKRAAISAEPADQYGVAPPPEVTETSLNRADQMSGIARRHL